MTATLAITLSDLAALLARLATDSQAGSKPCGDRK